MKETINILCATDVSYVPYCGVMLTSVFESNKDSSVDVYILIDKPLPKKAQSKFASLAEKYNNKINYLQIDKSFLEKFPIKGMDYWSIATYYRLYATELLPSFVHRILYLDCDIIVDGKLDALWQTEMTDVAAGCVPDIFDYMSERPIRLGYPSHVGYFNAGVMLINVDYWREHNVGKQCLDFLASHYDVVEANDQDVLNAVLWNKKIQLPVTYNFQIQFLKINFYKELTKYQEDIDKARCHPVIIHYAAPIKPWQMMYYKSPYKDVWSKYKRQSQWWYLWPQLPKRKTINYLIKRYFLWPLGIMYKNDWID